MREHGVEAVTLRGCARTLGVASSATFKHFRDKRSVMSKVAARGFVRMVAGIRARRAATTDDREARLRAIGEGYVLYALADAEVFRVMFNGDLVDPDDAELLGANALLAAELGGVDGMVDACGTIEASRRGVLAWASVHGLAFLLIDGQLAAAVPSDPVERERWVVATLAVLAPALLA